MNESIAKQLHDLIYHARINLKSELDEELGILEDNVIELIEKQNTQEKPNE